MKEILIFANESDDVKEIVQHLIKKHFKITIFTANKFKDLTAFVGMSPLQVNIVVVKIANYYNWKYELSKYDVIVNMMKITDFPKVNIRVVFENFTLAFGQAVKDLGKTVIYLSNVHNEFMHYDTVLNAERAMLSQCDNIIYVKYGFLVHSQSQLLTDVLNANVVLLSKKVLNASVQITMVCDLAETVASVAAFGEEKSKNIVISGESYSLNDIIILMKARRKKCVIQVPHLFLMLASRFLKILPQRFYYKFYNYDVLSNILFVSSKKFRPDFVLSYTLFVKILDRHFKNFFSSEIE